VATEASALVRKNTARAKIRAGCLYYNILFFQLATWCRWLIEIKEIIMVGFIGTVLASLGVFFVALGQLDVVEGFEALCLDGGLAERGLWGACAAREAEATLVWGGVGLVGLAIWVGALVFAEEDSAGMRALILVVGLVLAVASASLIPH